MTLKKKLTSIAAICSSVFLLAACEPRDDGVGTTGETDTGMGTTQDDAQTYGQRDRDLGTDPALQDPATQDPAMQDPVYQQEDPALQQDPGAGTTTDDDVGTAF